MFGASSNNLCMLHSINIFLHVAVGIIAILVALVSYGSQKGGTVHVLSGRIFLGLMAIVVATAFIGVIFFRDRPFLTVITFLVFYNTVSGYRVVTLKNRGFQRLDFLIMAATLLITASFLIRIQTANIVWNKTLVYYTVGHLTVLVGFDVLRYFKRTLISNPRFWVYEHIYKMTGAFVGLVSAGAGTVFADYAPWNQLVPVAVGNLLLVFSLLYFPKKLFRSTAVK